MSGRSADPAEEAEHELGVERRVLKEGQVYHNRLDGKSYRHDGPGIMTLREHSCSPV